MKRKKSKNPHHRMFDGNLHWSPFNQQQLSKLTKSPQLSKGKLSLFFLKLSGQG